MAGGAAPAIAPPQPGTITTHEPALPDKERRECHTVDLDKPGYAICGFRFPGGGGGDQGSGRHTRAECVAAGHLHCQPCLALEELGLDGRRF